MGVVISKSSELGKELERWNTPRNRPIVDENGEPMRDLNGVLIMGMGAVGFEPYPKMLFKARINPQTGKPSVGEVPPHPAHFTEASDLERATLFVESFNRSCQMIVRSEPEERMHKGQGWCVTQTEALEQFEKEQQYFAQIAAEEAYKAKRMSEGAQAERAEAEAATHRHVLDVVPQKKRGRPAKGVDPVTA